VEDQIAEQFDETNAYAFEMQQNESTSLSPIKNKNQEQFVDEIQTMVKKSKKKVINALN
jgi:DNA anti-recombination protein RmuC